MNDLVKEMESVVIATSEKELVERLADKEESFELSHGSHNQHSSSKEY